MQVSPPGFRHTIVEVVYPPHRGAIGVRGSLAPLSWEHTTEPTRSDGDHHWFVLSVPQGETLELKLVRGADDWAQGRNYSVHAGDHLLLQPAFDRTHCELLPPATVSHCARTLTYQVLLPPSYGEQDSKRYPVLYAQDGQALWSTSPDPFGVWRLDETLNNLLDLAVIDELIVVAIDTAKDRLDTLGPVPDPEYGGGSGPAHLTAIVEGLKPVIDAQYRTLTAREHTCAKGSSMGGLFSFYAAWTRSEVFGKAIGQSHNAGSWAARVAIPLQLLFPAAATRESA